MKEASRHKLSWRMLYHELVGSSSKGDVGNGERFWVEPTSCIPKKMQIAKMSVFEQNAITAPVARWKSLRVQSCCMERLVQVTYDMNNERKHQLPGPRRCIAFPK